MLTYGKIRRKPKMLGYLTGLTPPQFEGLVRRFHPLWEAAERQRLSRADRQRKIGAGRPYKLATSEDKLLLALLFYRLYVNYNLLELLFDLENSQIYRLLSKLEPLVEGAADPYLKGRLQRLNNRSRRIKTIEEFIAVYPELKEIIIDATEQKRLKPKDKRREKRAFSGKRKTHTVKTQIVTDRQGRILDISPSVGGRTHDTTLLRESSAFQHLPDKAEKLVDLGYEGILTRDQIPKTIIPMKRRRDWKRSVTPVLTAEEKDFNRHHSRRRIIIENTFARLKKYGILSQTYRSCEKRYNQIFRNIAALANFRLEYLKPNL